jgi:hypothetical protein
VALAFGRPEAPVVTPGSLPNQDHRA